jgi:ABC-type nitrate/sulfonate/bicarbonate transport system substrate-binding protein
MEENLAKVKGIVRAHVKATNFINNNRVEATKIGVKYTGMDEKTVGLAMKTINYTYRLSIEGEVEYVDFLNKLGYISVGDARVFTNKLINQEILQEVTER